MDKDAPGQHTVARVLGDAVGQNTESRKYRREDIALKLLTAFCSNPAVLTTPEEINAKTLADGVLVIADFFIDCADNFEENKND